jgi:hypothetical protein
MIYFDPQTHSRPCRICHAPTPAHRRERFCSPSCRAVWKESYGALSAAPPVPTNATKNNPANKKGGSYA